MYMLTPWQPMQMTARQEILTRLTANPIPVSSIISEVTCTPAAADRALHELVNDSLAVASVGNCYSLPTPLAWHGSFMEAVIKNGMKNLIVSDPHMRGISHLFVCDMLITGTRLPGEERTLSLLACGDVARNPFFDAGTERGGDLNPPAPTCFTCRIIANQCLAIRTASDPFTEPALYINLTNMQALDGKSVELLLRVGDANGTVVGRVRILDEQWIEIEEAVGHVTPLAVPLPSDGRIRIDSVVGVRVGKDGICEI